MLITVSSMSKPTGKHWQPLPTASLILDKLCQKKESASRKPPSIKLSHIL